METFRSIKHQVDEGLLRSAEVSDEQVKTILSGKRAVSYEEWLKVDKFELARGAENKKIREKVVELSKYFEIIESFKS